VEILLNLMGPLNRIVRLNLDGTVDDSFNVGAGFTGVLNTPS
jgi:hypothetical protein